MKKELPVPALAAPGTYQEVFQEEGRTLLSVQARWPRLEGEGPGVRRVGRYYEALAQRWKKRWAGPLLEAARAAGTDAPPWKARLDFTVTLFNETCLSLYWEVAEDVGARRPRRIRQGDVWRLPQGVPVALRELLPPARGWRRETVEDIRRQIGERVGSGEAVFYENWSALAARAFSPGRFYLTREGPVVFYPVETVAPALEGFPCFLLQIPPEKGA